jgi:hypothetical protein
MGEYDSDGEPFVLRRRPGICRAGAHLRGADSAGWGMFAPSERRTSLPIATIFEPTARFHEWRWAAGLWHPPCSRRPLAGRVRPLMEKIEAVIRPFKLDEVKDALMVRKPG